MTRDELLERALAAFDDLGLDGSAVWLDALTRQAQALASLARRDEALEGPLGSGGDLDLIDGLTRPDVHTRGAHRARLPGSAGVRRGERVCGWDRVHRVLVHDRRVRRNPSTRQRFRA